MVVSQAKLLKVMVKHDGNHTKTAKEIGISQAAVTKRVNRNPDIKKKLLSVREEALRKAGISRSKVYKTLNDGLKSNLVIVHDGLPFETKIADRKERREYAKICLHLYGDLKEDDKEAGISNIGMMIFNILTNPNRKTIDVV